MVVTNVINNYFLYVDFQFIYYFVQIRFEIHTNNLITNYM